MLGDRYKIIMQDYEGKIIDVTRFICGKEYVDILKDLLEQRFEIDTKISMRLGHITKEKGQLMLEKTEFKLVKPL